MDLTELAHYCLCSMPRFLLVRLQQQKWKRFMGWTTLWEHLHKSSVGHTLPSALLWHCIVLSTVKIVFYISVKHCSYFFRSKFWFKPWLGSSQWDSILLHFWVERQRWVLCTTRTEACLCGEIITILVLIRWVQPLASRGADQASLWGGLRWSSVYHLICSR